MELPEVGGEKEGPVLLERDNGNGICVGSWSFLYFVPLTQLSEMVPVLFFIQ